MPIKVLFVFQFDLPHGEYLLYSIDPGFLLQVELGADDAQDLVQRHERAECLEHLPLAF